MDLFNSKGGLKNTQQLGTDVIRALNARTIPATTTLGPASVL
ncbi:hypothetical protein [Sinorhizobium meliloti]